MTSAQPRVPAGTPGGGRFASTACPRVYALLDASGPDPDPVRQLFPGLPSSVVGVSGSTSRVVVPTTRCPHGSFTGWAVRNCCR